MDRKALEQDFRTYNAAGRGLNTWLSGARALALLRCAISSGIFDAARTPSTVAEICDVTGVGESRAADICLALEAHGILDRSGERYRLSEEFAVLGSPDAVQSLPSMLATEKVLERALESSASPQEPYTSLSSDDISTMAAGVGMRPLPPAARTMLVLAITGSVPEVQRLWQEGARILEIGCGTASVILSLLATHPKLRAVGIETDEGALAIARWRAQELGVSDRLELRHADARELDEEEAFDTAQWGQQFFPEEDRAEVLAAAFRALKPGGYLMVTMFGDAPASVEALREPAGRSYALNRLVYGGWGVPVLSSEELRAQIENAGFEVVRTTFPPFNPLMVNRGLMLARRPQT